MLTKDHNDPIERGPVTTAVSHKRPRVPNGMTEIPDDNRDKSEELDQLQRDDTLVDRGVDDALDEGYSPPEKWSTAQDHGTTHREQLEGESLDDRLAQEEPELSVDVSENVSVEVGDRRAGRLTQEDGFGREDVDTDMEATDVGIDGGAAGAEEAAVHVIDEDA
jgi:hypothetical protein